MNRTMTVGRISELAFARKCLEYGIPVFQPMGTERYDVLIEMSGQYRRVQVKTGRVRAGAIRFKSCSNAEGVGKPRGYAGDADDIGVFVPELEQCYLIAVTTCPRGGGILRVDPPANGQASRVRWARDYELAHVLAQASLQSRILGDVAHADTRAQPDHG